MQATIPVSKAPTEAYPGTKDHLREWFPRDSSVSCVRIGTNVLVLAIDNGQIVDVSWAVRRVLAVPFARHMGVKVRGGGMDPCDSLISDLAQVLYGDAVALRARKVI